LSLLTLAPLPSWHNLLKAFFYRSADDEKLTLPWRHIEDKAFLFSRSAWSLLAIASCCKRLSNKANLNVWIPDFFCNESLVPLREMGVNLIFYPVTREMTPNLVVCELFAKKTPPDIFLLVDYFGQPITSELIIAFCKNYESWIIKDSTHVLQPMFEEENVADCVIYSPHKHLPIPDGAVLVIKKNGPSRLLENKRIMIIFNKVISDLVIKKGNARFAPYLWLFKRIIQRSGLHINFSKKIFNAIVGGGAIQSLGSPRMHNISKCMLTHSLDKLDLIGELRKKNEKMWLNVMKFAMNAPKFLPRKIDATPYLAGFISSQTSDAESLFNLYQQSGFPVTIWPNLPPEVINNEVIYKHAIELRSNGFYLPVHQTLSEYELFECGKNVLQKTTQNWHAKLLSYDEWKTYWNICPENNLLQSWHYGEAKEKSGGWQSQRFLILDNLEHPIAIAQILTKTFSIFGGIARLNRGPLLLNNYIDDADIPIKLGVLNVLIKEARRQRWWIFQIAPEIKDCEIARYTLRAFGLKLQNIHPWASGLIDLNLSEDELHGNLNRRWKRAIRKSLEFGVVIENEKLTISKLDEILKGYKNMQESNAFKGIDEKLIRKIFAAQSIDLSINLFVAKKINENGLYDDIGYRLCIYCGYTALDFIVSTNNAGLELDANSGLYWHAILHAKKSGCRWFDIGGLNETTPRGIAEFKNGLNSNPYKLVGEWRKWF